MQQLKNKSFNVRWAYSEWKNAKEKAKTKNMTLSAYLRWLVEKDEDSSKSISLSDEEIKELRDEAKKHEMSLSDYVVWLKRGF